MLVETPTPSRDNEDCLPAHGKCQLGGKIGPPLRNIVLKNEAGTFASIKGVWSRDLQRCFGAGEGMRCSLLVSEGVRKGEEKDRGLRSQVTLTGKPCSGYRLFPRRRPWMARGEPGYKPSSQPALYLVPSAGRIS